MIHLTAKKKTNTERKENFKYVYLVSENRPTMILVSACIVIIMPHTIVPSDPIKFEVCCRSARIRLSFSQWHTIYLPPIITLTIIHVIYHVAI